MPSGIKAAMDARRNAVREYQRLVPGKPAWPRSNAELSEMLSRIDYAKKHRTVIQELASVTAQLDKFSLQESFSGRDKYFTFTPESGEYNEFSQKDIRDIIRNVLPGVLSAHPTIKVGLSYNVDMRNIKDLTVIQNRILNALSQTVFASDDLDRVAERFYHEIKDRSESHQNPGSGWTVDAVNGITVTTSEFTMTRAGSYVRLPDCIIAKRACINVKNSDDKCIMWALLSALFPADKNADRVSKYTAHTRELDLTGIEFPTPPIAVKQIEQQNQKLFPGGINVYELDKSMKPYPYYISPACWHVTDDTTVNILHWQGHYCWIKDFSRFASQSVSAHHGKMYFCYRCLTGHTSQQKLIDHNKYCTTNTAMVVPDPDKNILSFRKQQREHKIPFVIYGDFESFIVPVNAARRSARTRRVQEHIPASYCLNTVCVNDKYSKLSPVYRINNWHDLPPEVHMLLYLFEEQSRIQSILTIGDKYKNLKSYKCTTVCYCCRKSLYGEASGFQDKVPLADISGQYVGAVHESCRQFQKFIPVIFHNLRGYDGHFILRALGHPAVAEYCRVNRLKISCIPSNSEKLLSLSVGKLRFIDSIQFMNSSLDNLARNCSCLRYTNKYYPDKFCSEKIFKGIFPYEYFTGPWIFREKMLPPASAFYSSLSNQNISDEQYSQALAAWDQFQCDNFGDYHDAYLQLDVLLLTDVFEEFRVTALAQYKLDPAHYFSAPGLSWDAALRHSQIKLELLTDPDMYLFIEKGTRGGVSVISKKYSRANNKYLHDYDPDSDSSYICYLDANNLYGAAMSEPLPVGGFKWISPEEFLAATKDDPTVGYFVDADIDYPASLHHQHNCYPYLPEHIVITDDMLSRQQLALRTNNSCPWHKLVPNLFDKKNYIGHWALLKQAIDAGLVLKKVHRVLQFHQQPWLASYIHANTTRRTAAKTDFEKDFFKLMNNSVFGKTMENVRKRVNVEIVNDLTRRNKLTRGDCFVSSRRISDNLTLITRKQKTLKLNKPIYVGAAILDLSKIIMYDFHYKFFRKQFPASTLLMTDTDSLVYEVHCEDLYQDIFDNRGLFDLSDVSANGTMGKFHDATKKKVIGKFKDEFAFKPVREFCGLRSKMYAMVTDDETVVKRAKGVNRGYVKTRLSFDDYLDALARTPGVELPTVTTRGFRSYHHVVVTDEITRTGLSNYDDKRFTVDGIVTTALGHFGNQSQQGYQK